MNKIVALIPARGGSKSIHRKNIRLLNGIPLIEYTIRIALQNKQIDRVIVSTDDIEIAEIGKKCGAEVPFLRPELLANDTAPDKVVIEHLLSWLYETENEVPEMVLYLRPTTPFKTNTIIDECIDVLKKDQNASAVRTVTLAEGVNHPYWMFKNENGYLKSFVNDIDISKYFQRQLLPECLRLNGVVDVLRPEVMKKGANIYGDQIRFIEVPPINSVDIDTEFDFRFAEFLLSNEMILK